MVIITLAGIRHNFLIGVVAVAILLGSGVMSFRQWSLQSSQITKSIGTTVSITFQIVSDPTKSNPKVFGSNVLPSSYSFLASTLVLENERHTYRLRIPIRVFGADTKLARLLPGQKVRASGRVKSSKESRVAGNFMVRGPVKVLTSPSRWARVMASIRDGLRRNTPKGDAGALIPGMVLGDTSLQSENFRTAMKRSGLTHLVAVSGANFAIISLFVLWSAQWFFRRIRTRLIFTAVALGCFISLVRPSPSVLRAAAMACVVLCARGLGKRSDPVAALGFAIAAVVISDPWQARDPGFALSVLATAGLILIAPRLSMYFARFFPKLIAEALSIPLAAVLMCAPILVALSGYFGLMTVFANLLAAPMVAPITIIGFIAALLAPLQTNTSQFLLTLIYYPAAWIAGVAHWASHFPVLNVGKGLFGFLLTFAVISIFIFSKSRRIALVLLLAFLVTTSWVGNWPGGEWEVANCDVGQGDSLAINLGQHRAIVIDTGPDAGVEDRCLSQLGIRNIELLVLTHFHADHVEGLSGLLRNRKVANAWVSNNDQPAIESQRVRTLLSPLIPYTPLQGSAVTLQSFRGTVAIKVLWPPSVAPECGDLPGDGSLINNSSIVLEIRTKDFSLLATGDVEPCPQSQIEASRADIVKVPHHGSMFQDSAFLARMRPTISIISVGAGNSYGHPSPRTLQALARLRSRIYRTDLVGAIAIKASNHQFTVRTSGGAWWKKVRLG